MKLCNRLVLAVAAAVPAGLLAIGCAAPETAADQASAARPQNVELTTFPSAWTYQPGAVAPSAEHGMVTSNSALGTQAGVEILEAGGNAVDAAVAVGFALAVAYPEAGNLGGGGYTVVRLADGQTAALDYREVAPAKATRDMYIGPDGKLTRDSIVGHRASGVPGSVAGLLALLERYGTMPRAQVMAPAIRLARDGFIVDEIFNTSVGLSAKGIEPFAGHDLFLPDGAPPPIDSRFTQPDLASTLERIAEEGADGFYRGPVADAVAAEMTRGGGLITTEDLASYEPAWRTPVTSTYRGHGLVAMPPSSSGGVTLVEALNILETWEKPAPWGTPEALHRLASAFQRAFVDRNALMGDPAFVTVPVEQLASKDYARTLRAGIDEGRATPTSEIHPLGESTDTTPYAVVDRWGNAVATTTTINGLYGSGVWIPDAGFFMNNEMDDFAAQPGTPNMFGLVQGEANAIAPGKRMLSAMSPTIVLDPDGAVEMLVGGRGGPRIITAVAQAIVNVVDHGMSLADAVGAPRIHHQALPEILFYEEGGFEAGTIAALEQMGYTTQPGGSGNLTAIARTSDGWAGIFDPRKHGLAAGY